jgi:hypothetical protein
LIIVAIGAAAQQADTSAVGPTVKKSFLPTGVRIGTDVLALVKSSVQDNFHGWEFNSDIDFNRYYLAVDYGQWGRDLASDSASYHNDGHYWRAGIDVNFLVNDPERNMFFIGLRYGHASFSDRMEVITTDPLWGDLSASYSNAQVRSRWLELTTGLRVKMYKFIWMGYTARFKFALKNQGDDQMLPHDVPGYGRTDRETYWGFNYQLFFRIPFRKLPPPPPAKKK